MSSSISMCRTPRTVKCQSKPRTVIDPELTSSESENEKRAVAAGGIAKTRSRMPDVEMLGKCGGTCGSSLYQYMSPTHQRRRLAQTLNCDKTRCRNEPPRIARGLRIYRSKTRWTDRQRNERKYDYTATIIRSPSPITAKCNACVHV